MYDRILVPLDGSPLAEQALPYARLLAKALDVRMDLLQVVEAAGGVEPATIYLEGVKLRLQRLGLEVRPSVQVGRPAEEIIAEVEEAPDTLVAMATHGRSGIGRWALGSVTDRVLHASPGPLLVVRPRDSVGVTSVVGLTTIIVPLDGSELAEQVLPHAIAAAKALLLNLLLVRATPTIAQYAQAAAWQAEEVRASFPALEQYAAEVDQAARDYLERVAQELRHQKGLLIETRLLHGEPAGAIIDLARQMADNLVAMTTHGRTGLGRWVLGSVTDRVVRHSGDPVLVVRAKETA